MKSLIRNSPRGIPKPMVALVVVLLSVLQTFSQLPDCASGNVMYSLWNDSLSGNVPSQIRPVNYTTGAVGGMMGGAGFMISRTISGTPYYGSSALGMDANRFYTVTTMGFAGGRKDFIAINTNPTPTTTIIATSATGSTATVPLSSGLSDYFFVKMAVSPFNMGYTIGIHRDTTIGGFSPAVCSPLISFTPCGTAGCATLRLLGFLPTTYPSHNWEIYNGDIAFNSVGDMYYMAAGYERVNGSSRYTNIRLFKIDAIDIPSTTGTGIIPMTFIADYNSLDSTVLNGLAFDAVGAMYISTRRFNGVQATTPAPTFTNELYKTASVGVATVMSSYGPRPATFVASDLASCYFPLIVLDRNVLNLSAKYASGYAELTWNVNDNNRVNYFEIQRSNDGENFETIARVNPANTGRADHSYTYRDAQSGFGKPMFYRIRENMLNGGIRFYSNISKVNFNSKINVVSKPKPNPFVSYVDFDVQLKASASIAIRLIDESGKVLYSRKYDGHAGDNKITVNDFAHLAPGVYIAELGVDDEVVREKIFKNNQEP